MACDCRHEQMGLCTRYPKTNTVVMGRLVWAFPPADRECGERAPRTGASKATAHKPVKRAKPASDGGKTASNEK